MSYSRRQLEAFGEPLGDSATHVKAGGFGRIYGGGGSGGGGGGNNTTTSTGTTYNTNIPEYARPYVETMLGATQKQLFEGTPTEGGGFDITGFKPYTPYSQNPEDYVAPFSPMQEQAMRTAASPQAFGQQVSGYMSPYMQNVVDVQKREAARTAGILGAQNQAQATNAGAFGGYREGLQRAENQRNLMTQMGDIQAKGSQAAFDQAQQQARTAQNLQMQYGTMAQSQAQQKINQSIQDYANAQQYPLMQLGVMSNMLRGLPMQAATTNQYVAAPNPITQGIGVAGAGASIYNAMKGASGGLPKEFKYASGGITDVDDSANTPDPNERTGIREYVEAQNARNAPRYSVGGEVKAQLEDMPIEELQRQASSSSSPTIRAMAKEVLAEKQMAQAEAAKNVGPTGPMGVQYEAPPVQSAARGGILAFKEPNENNNYGVTDSSSMDGMQLAGVTRSDVDKAYGDWQATMPSALERQTVTGSGKENAARSNYEKVLQEYQSQRDTSQPGSSAPIVNAAEAKAIEAAAPAPERVPKQDRGIPQAVTRAEPVRPQLNTERPSTPEQERLAGIYAAQQKAKAPAAPAAETTPAPTKDRTGIMAATSAPAKPAPAPAAKQESAIGALEKEAADTRKEADRSLEDFHKEQQALREKLGIGEDKGAQEYRQKIMEERANSKDEAERQRWMRAAQFFASWGSTPGSTLAAGLNALQKTIPDIVADAKDQKKANRELDKVMYDIDHAIRLEKKGQFDDAMKAKEKAAERAEKLNERLWMYKQGVDVANINKEAHMASAAATRESTAEYKRATNINAAFGRYQAAGNELERVRHAIETENAKDDAYTRAQRTIATYNSVEKPDASLTKMYEAAQGVVAAKDAKNLPRIQAAEKDVQSAYKHYTNMGGGDVKTPSAAPAPTNTTMTMADVEATAKKSGKTVDEVKAAAKAKGYTIK